MKGLGTIINVALIVVGGILGLLFGKKISEKSRESVMNVMGVTIILLGVGGTLSKMLVLNEGKLETTGTMMMIVTLTIGTLIGELIDIDGWITSFGNWLKNKTGNSGDNSFINGFVTATCTVSIGAMAIMGSIQDGISNDPSTLITKGILDCVIICVMTVSLGKGAIFSAIPVGIFQGLVTVLAIFAGNFMCPLALEYLSYVGNILILCVGLNLVREKKIAVANMLPAIILACVYGTVV